MKTYKIEMIGWEMHVQIKNISTSEVEECQNIDDAYEIDNKFLNGNGDYENCLLSDNEEMKIIVSDEEDELFTLNKSDEGFLTLDEFTDYDYVSESLNINDYDNELMFIKEYSESSIYYSFDSDSLPKKEDFTYTTFCIRSRGGDWDMINAICFKGQPLEQESLESGKQKHSRVKILTSDGSEFDIT